MCLGKTLGNGDGVGHDETSGQFFEYLGRCHAGTHRIFSRLDFSAVPLGSGPEYEKPSTGDKLMPFKFSGQAPQGDPILDHDHLIWSGFVGRSEQEQHEIQEGKGDQEQAQACEIECDFF